MSENYEQQLKVPVTPWQRDQVQEIATRRRVSLAEVCRQAIREYLEAHGYSQK